MKNLPYWLKGGLIGFVISAAASLYLFNLNMQGNTTSDCMAQDGNGFAPCFDLTFIEFLGILYPYIIGFIIFLIFLGFILGKVKSRPKSVL